jgi:hypothetical protein
MPKNNIQTVGNNLLQFTSDEIPSDKGCITGFSLEINLCIKCQFSNEELYESYILKEIIYNLFLICIYAVIWLKYYRNDVKLLLIDHLHNEFFLIKIKLNSHKLMFSWDLHRKRLLKIEYTNLLFLDYKY